MSHGLHGATKYLARSSEHDNIVSSRLPGLSHLPRVLSAVENRWYGDVHRPEGISVITPVLRHHGEASTGRGLRGSETVEHKPPAHRAVGHDPERKQG